MGRLATALTQTILSPLSTFWPQDWNAGALAGAASRHTNVTPESAMGVTAWYSGVRFLSETVASLPLIVYRRLTEGGKDRASDHPMYRLLHDQANPEMTAFTWRETVMGHVVGWGNGYSERQLDARGRTVALWPLRPDAMQVRRDNGSIVYRYRLPGGGVVDLPAQRVFHVRGLGYDGLIGYSPVEIMRRALRLAMAAEEYGERTFDNDARPGVVYTHPKTLSDPARTNLENSIRRNHEGLTNAQRFAILEEGITVTSVGFPPADAQFLETRKFGVTETARGLRIPPHVLYDLDRSTNNNIEQQSIELVEYSLRSWLVRWEQQINVDLIGLDDVYFAEHLIDALLRGDALTRAQSLWIQRQAGVLNADEWREIENRNPIPGRAGEAFLQPLNMTPVGNVADGDQPDFVKPIHGVVPASDAVPDTSVIPNTVPAKPAAPSKNGHNGHRTHADVEPAVKSADVVAIERNSELLKALIEQGQRPIDIKNYVTTPEVKVTTPDVHVTTPDVHVDNHVAPARIDKGAVSVIVPGSKATRAPAKRVERDDRGRITRIVEE